MGGEKLFLSIKIFERDHALCLKPAVTGPIVNLENLIQKPPSLVSLYEKTKDASLWPYIPP